MTNENPEIPGDSRVEEGLQRLFWQNNILVCVCMTECVSEGVVKGVAVINRIDKVIEKNKKGG